MTFTIKKVVLNCLQNALGEDLILRIAKKYTAVFFAIIVLSLLTLCAASLMPQSRILANMQESVGQFEAEGVYPHMLDKDSKANKLDNFTDMIILNSSAYMDESESFSHILTNPFFRISDSGSDQVDSFKTAASGAPANEAYARYWMGFRAYIRPMLVFLDYAEIRAVNTFLFFSLFSGALLTLRKHCGLTAALAFVLTMLCFKPTVISSELQFTCCFIIAFTAVTLLPYVERSKLSFPLFFFIVGAVTQFFDFYTTPLVTLGFPLCCLLMMGCGRGTIPQRRRLWLECAASWLGAYIAMWLAKLTLTSLFADINGFANGFTSLAGHIGVIKDASRLEAYNALTALQMVFGVLLDKLNIVIFCAVLLIWALLFIRSRRKGAAFGENTAYLATAALPLLWYFVAAKPTIIHDWFQYRTLAVTVFALLVFLANTAGLTGRDGASFTSEDKSLAIKLTKKF